MMILKKISMVILAGLIAFLASFGAYSLKPYLFGNDVFSVTDTDLRLPADPVMSSPPKIGDQPPLSGNIDKVIPDSKAGIVASKDDNRLEKREPENSSPAEDEDESASEVAPGNTVEKRKLAYEAPDNGNPFSTPRIISDADSTVQFASQSARPTGDSRGDPGEGEDPDPEPDPPGEPDVDTPDPRSEPIARAEVVFTGQVVESAGEYGGTLQARAGGKASSEESFNEEGSRGEVTIAGTAGAAVTTKSLPDPDPDSHLATTARSLGKVKVVPSNATVQGGWYSNAMAGSVSGLIGGLEAPASSERVTYRLDQNGRVSLNGNRQGSRVTVGSSSGLVRSGTVIQSLPSANQAGVIFPVNPGVSPGAVPFVPPVSPSNIPTVGISGLGSTGISVGGVRIP